MNIQQANKIVIKVGSSLIADSQRSSLRETWLKKLCEDIAYITKQEKQVVVVSSGSVALGKKYIKHTKKILKLEEKQAAAACGQIELMHYYKKHFQKYNINAAQILLTIQDSDTRRNYLNARNTLNTLLNNNVVPVINENDTVATQELKFGDNDRLAARVAQMIEADLLIILSDIDGLYDSNPQLNKNAKHIAVVKQITKSITQMAGGSISTVGSGGMITKIEAAKIATNNGCNVIIGKGNINNPLKKLFKGAKHTLFEAHDTPFNAKKRWFYNNLSITSQIIIDDGAYKALLKGKSLLPAGVSKIIGDFDKGDAVIIKNQNNLEIGRGIVSYSSHEANLIKGHKTKDIESIIGLSGKDEIIHRDNMVIADEEVGENDDKL